jgi:hypothetical protein
MKPATTRTLNPLPFQDLEPHRFEDLIRQLAYDLRHWKSLEATGRSGSDEGLDIRGIEILWVDQEPVNQETEEEDMPVLEERLWVFQCKREKSLSPKKIKDVVESSLASLAVPPHGFVLAVACDVSKKTRDNFRKEMVARGIEEFFLWAKGELEDMLFQPRNDRLLFAYFGLSLQPRRRSLTTTLRSQIAKKKQLTTLLGEETNDGKLILLRDPTDERYPHEPKDGDSPARWFACHAISMKKPAHLVVLRHEHLAATTPGGEHWDAILSHDNEEATIERELRAENAWAVEDRDHFNSTPHGFWNEYIADQDRACLKVYRFVPLDRVLAVDPLGDGFFPIPQVFVDFDGTNGPFRADDFSVLERASGGGGRIDLDPQKSNRVEIFPNPLPEDLDLPPKAFDMTRDSTEPLSAGATGKFADLFASVTKQTTNDVASEIVGAREREIEGTMRLFGEWRDRVALPVLSAFVHLLRAEGHIARVVVRSSKPIRHGQAKESVEIRVQLRVGSFRDTPYRPAGHVRVSVAEYSGWQLDVSPRPDSSHNFDRQDTLEVMEKERLEERVLSMLQLLQSRGY